MAKAKKTALAAVLSVLALLIVAVTVLSFIKVDDGFNDKKVTPYQIQLVKGGRYIYTMQWDTEHAVLNDKSDKFEEFVDAYYGMTSYSIMMGILEGKFYPQARLTDALTDVLADVRTISAESGQYLISIIFDESEGKEQQAEIKVKKGTKDDPISVKIGDTTYNEGDKVSFKYNSVVLIVDENNYINDLTLYAFDRAMLNDSDFVAYKMTVKANRINLFNLCKKILP